eukprot:GHVO01027982.1.p1 GENE.GHVO01027982.1~~GHVO01027982.1.p1  ORF type:complete len:292 (+),score=37.74 GHVO01027982.1:94-969(+)
MKPEQERLVAVLKDTVSLLCKNSLTYEEQVVVQGVICITVDKQDVVVVPVHENLGLAEYDPCLACGHAKEPPPGEKNSRKRKRRRRSSSGASRSPETYDDPREEEYDEDAEEAERVKIKKEEPELSDDEDLILIDEDIKREHNNNDNSFITGYMDNSQLSSITATPQSLSSQPQTQQQQLQQQQQHFQGPASWQGTPGAASTQALAMPDGSDGMAASQKVQEDLQEYRLQPYVCKWENCRRVFKFSCHLKRHEMTHTGEKPYKCPVCPHASNRKDNIQQHLTMVHPEHTNI